MSKLFKAQNAIRYQLDDDNTGKFTSIPYMVETVLTVVGPDILVQNPIDPNIDDFTIIYANVSSPVTANVQDLVDLMYCWISEELPDVITNLTDTPVVYDAQCNALQSFGGDLYWRGQLLSTGGGGYTETIINISSVEILTMGAGILLLPALGSMQYYDIESIIFEFTPNTIPYITGGIVNDLQLFYNVGTTFITGDLITSFVNAVAIVKNQIKDNNQPTYGYIDLDSPDGLWLYTDTNANFSNGDGTLRVIIYSVIRTFGA